MKKIAMIICLSAFFPPLFNEGFAIQRRNAHLPDGTRAVNPGSGASCQLNPRNSSTQLSNLDQVTRQHRLANENLTRTVEDARRSFQAFQIQSQTQNPPSEEEDLAEALRRSLQATTPPPPHNVGNPFTRPTNLDEVTLRHRMANQNLQNHVRNVLQNHVHNGQGTSNSPRQAQNSTHVPSPYDIHKLTEWQRAVLPTQANQSWDRGPLIAAILKAYASKRLVQLIPHNLSSAMASPAMYLNFTNWLKDPLLTTLAARNASHSAADTDTLQQIYQSNLAEMKGKFRTNESIGSFLSQIQDTALYRNNRFYFLTTLSDVFAECLRTVELNSPKSLEIFQESVVHLMQEHGASCADNVAAGLEMIDPLWKIYEARRSGQDAQMIRKTVVSSTLTYFKKHLIDTIIATNESVSQGERFQEVGRFTERRGVEYALRAKALLNPLIPLDLLTEEQRYFLGCRPEQSAYHVALSLMVDPEQIIDFMKNFSGYKMYVEESAEFGLLKTAYNDLDPSSPEAQDLLRKIENFALNQATSDLKELGYLTDDPKYPLVTLS